MSGLAEDAKFIESTPSADESILSLSLNAHPPPAIELHELPSVSPLTETDEKTAESRRSGASPLDAPAEAGEADVAIETQPAASTTTSPKPEEATSDPETTETGIKDLKEIFARPMVFYKRNNPSQNRNAKQHPGPTGIVMPDQSVTVGSVPNKDPEQFERERNPNETMLIFASPGDDQVGRNRVLAYLLYCLIPCDFILITVIFLQGGSSVQYPLNEGDQVVADGLSYSVTVMILALGILGMQLRDTRLLTLFLVAFYVDSLLSLIRVYTVLQFSHYIIQLAICHIMSQFKSTLLATWFQPS